ncbi:hypothetical protein HY490_02680, partial [Candidatus Woesearchaeota archaeon]|nr:hypothetical protein [Candidatus Woesearchaeota archaeon]
MHSLKAFLVDLTYKVEGDKPVILLFCRTAEGKRVCIRDRNFEPYFVVTAPAECVPKIHALSVSEDGVLYRVIRVEAREVNIRERSTTAYHVFCNIPKAVAKLRDLARGIPEVTGVYEDDILFVRRYVIDKKVMPLSLVEAHGEFVDDSVMRIPVFEAAHIEPVAGIERLSPKVLAFDIETYYQPSSRGIDFQKNPILSISLYGDGIQKCITWKKFPSADNRILFAENEAGMIRTFVELVNAYAPDVITGYNSDGFDFPYLVKRASLLKTALDLGADGSPVRMLGTTNPQAEISGIAHVDVFKFIRHVMMRSLKTDVFTLDAVSAEVLGDRKIEVDLDKLHEAWDAAAPDLQRYMDYNIHDSKLTYDLCRTYWPSMLEFVQLIGLPLVDVTRMSFSTLVEWFIIKKAVSAGEVILSKPKNTDERKRMRQQVKGGFVLEPTPGVYTNIAVFDYRSLYPSIIASHNISLGTLGCDCCRETGRVPTDRGDFWFCTKK